jgi:DNA-binding NarL/FixJ family response regulator
MSNTWRSYQPECLDLSERELEVLLLAAGGANNQAIANRLVIARNTVKVHLRNIYYKLGVSTRTEAALEALRRGWATLEDIDHARDYYTGGQPFGHNHDHDHAHR